jgi:hypothetical protein
MFLSNLSNQIAAYDRNLARDVNRATVSFYAVANRPLVNIQPRVIHSLHGRASLVFLNQDGR